MPSPQVDEEFIAIDETGIETLSLGSGIQTINPWSGKNALTSKAKSQLKPRALEIAKRPECMFAAERMARGHIENLVHSVAVSLLQLSAGKVPPIAVLVQFSSAVGIPAFEKQRISEAVQPSDRSA
jgi:hypothetical protein